MLLNKGIPSVVVLVIGTVLASADALLAADPVISEIMYHPASGSGKEEFLELYNTGSRWT